MNVEFRGNQLWESTKYVLKIEQCDKPESNNVDQHLNMRAVIFTKKVHKNGTKELRFLEFVWKDEEYLRRLIKHMHMQLTKKHLTLV